MFPKRELGEEVKQFTSHNVAPLFLPGSAPTAERGPLRRGIRGSESPHLPQV